jgi:hypothetical protein
MICGDASIAIFIAVVTFKTNARRILKRAHIEWYHSE